MFFFFYEDGEVSSFYFWGVAFSDTLMCFSDGAAIKAFGQ